ncbi:MAG: porin [Idiomarina sp.]|nr:porin [Idiomarina sp.]
MCRSNRQGYRVSMPHSHSGNRSARKIAVFTTFIGVLTATPAFAEQPKIDFYGKLHVSGDYLDDGDNGGLNVSSNSSRIGFKLAYELEPGMQLIGQVERTIDMAEGQSTFSSRNTFVGVQGEWGTLRAGFYDSPVKRILNAVEQFREQVGEGRNIVRSGEMHFDRRFRSGIHYTSPTLNNLTWIAHYGTSEQAGANTDTKNDAYSTSLTYAQNGWTGIIGYEHQNREFEPALTGTRAALIRTNGALTSALFYQYASGMETGSQQVYGVTGAYALDSQYSLKAQVFHRTANASNALDSTMFTVGINRKVNAAVSLYATASHTQNAQLATANVSAGGHGKTLVIEPGNDPFALSVGLNWSF